jgi:hypothetical protein
VFCAPKVLLLTGDENEGRSLQEILGDYADLVRVHGLSEMESHLEEGNCDVLFCAWAFYRAFWNGALQEMPTAIQPYLWLSYLIPVENGNGWKCWEWGPLACLPSLAKSRLSWPS